MIHTAGEAVTAEQRRTQRGHALMRVSRSPHRQVDPRALLMLPRSLNVRALNAGFVKEEHPGLYPPPAAAAGPSSLGSASSLTEPGAEMTGAPLHTGNAPFCESGMRS